jgi:hypothetical protein
MILVSFALLMIIKDASFPIFLVDSFHIPPNDNISAKQNKTKQVRTSCCCTMNEQIYKIRLFYSSKFDASQPLERIVGLWTSKIATLQKSVLIP